MGRVQKRTLVQKKYLELAGFLIKSCYTIFPEYSSKYSVNGSTIRLGLND
jgi:hypothetical protein